VATTFRHLLEDVMASYSGNFSSNMMENHIPASVLDAANGFSAVVGGDGTQFLFSIGSDSVFRASADLNDGVSAWVTQDISASLVAQPAESLSATIKAKTFAVSYSTTTDTITIVLVLSRSTGGDLVYAASGLPANATASWLAQNGIGIWQAIPFDSTAFTSITAQTLDISAVSLLLAVKVSAQEPAQAFATVIDPSNQHYRVFTISIPQPGVPSNSPAWKSFTLPVDSNVPLLTAPGQPVAALGQGLYLLASIAGSSALQFMPSAIDITVSYTVPTGASAIASLALPDSGASTLTELYVAGGNTLTICPAGRGVTNVQVCSSSYFAGTSVLHVVSNYGEEGVKDSGAILAVWGLNAHQQIFFTYAPYTDRQDPTAWSPVTLLMSQVSNVTPLLNSNTGTLGFLGITASPDYTTINYGPPASSSLVQMYSDQASLAWQSRYVPVPSTGDYIRLQSYTSTVRVIDPTTTLPVGNAQLNITTATSTNFIVNGQSVNCQADTPTPVTTDVSGRLTIVNTVSGISAVPFTITDTEGDAVTLTLNGTAVAQPYDPTGTITPALQQGITGDLTSISYKSSDGTTSPLVSSSNSNLVHSQPQISAAFNALSDKVTATSTPSSSALLAVRGNALTARVRYARSLQARRAHAAAAASTSPGAQATTIDDNNSIEMILSDLAQWVITAVEDVESFFINVADEVVTLVVSFAEGVFHAVVSTVEDALNAVVALFNYIGAAFEDIFRWLAFIFDWSEMVAVHNSLSTAFQAGINGFEKELTSIQSTIDNWFAQARSSLGGPTFSGAIQTIQQGVATNQPATTVVGGTDVSSDSRIGWVGAQLKTSQGSSISQPTVVAAGSGGTLADAMAGFGSSTQSASSEKPAAIIAVGQSANGSGSTGIAASGFMSSIGTTLLTDLQTVVDDGFSLLEDGIADANSALTATINVPVLSGIYFDVVDKEPSVLDISCLCMAVPMTICYNIAASVNSTMPALTDVVASNTFQSAFASFFSNTGTAQARERSVLRAAMADDDSDSTAALAIISGLLMVQSVSIVVDYIGEDMESSAMCTIAAILENLSDFGLCVTATFGAIDDPLFIDYKVAACALRLVVLIGLLQAVFLRGGLRSAEAGEIALGGDFADTILGLWALVDILLDVSDADSEDWADMFNNLLAFPGALLAKGKVMPYWVIVALLRAFGIEGLGCVFLAKALNGFV
jgi:hypothetical protein